MKRRVMISLFFGCAVLFCMAKLTHSSAQQIYVPDSPQVAGTIVRTLVYHELTTTTQGVYRDYPLISGDGNSIAYVALGDPHRVFVTNFDGTGTPREIATFPDRPKVDISYDGTTVMTTRGGGTTFGSEVRVFKSGAAAVTVWDKAGIEEPNIRLAPDGTRVFFQLRFDGGEYGRGIWVVSASGGAAQRVVSPEQVSAVIGIPAGDIEFWTSSAPGLDVSLDGPRVIFVVRAQGRLRVMGGRYAGNTLQGLHQILEAVDNYFVQYLTISADGTMVGYDITQPNGSTFEAGVINFDNINGQGKQVIATSDQISPPGGFPSNGNFSRLALNRDGSKLLLGTTSYWYDTPTRRVLQLGVSFGALTGDPPHIVASGLYLPSMSAAGTRFAYLRADLNGVEQVATCEITTTLGSAPNLSNPTIDPPFLLTNGRSAATLTVRATAGTGINRVSAAIMRNGIDEELIGDVGPAKPVLLPIGSDVYSNSNVRDRGNNTAPGPRLVRYLAETKTGDNKRHATAIDAESLTLAIIFIYLVLASQFESFLQPLAIMLSLPLSLVGVFLAMLATRGHMNMMAMIGLIMLMGLVTKNAILLVDNANQRRAEGHDRDDALVSAGQVRLRPIVMTTLAMIFGMLPLALALGEGSEFRAPMARAVIGGLISSTLLTLVVVPVVYTYLDSLGDWVVTKFRGPAPPTAPPPLRWCLRCTRRTSRPNSASTSRSSGSALCSPHRS